MSSLRQKIRNEARVTYYSLKVDVTRVQLSLLQSSLSVSMYLLDAGGMRPSYIVNSVPKIDKLLNFCKIS